MISILIPIYNQDVTKLINELADQASRAKVAFEILAFDDASKEKYKLINRKVNHLFGVNYSICTLSYRKKVLPLLRKYGC